MATYAAIRQGQICANGIAEIASGNDVFGKTMILAVFPELYSILAFAAAFLISNSILYDVDITGKNWSAAIIIILEDQTKNKY